MHLEAQMVLLGIILIPFNSYWILHLIFEEIECSSRGFQECTPALFLRDYRFSIVIYALSEKEW